VPVARSTGAACGHARVIRSTTTVTHDAKGEQIDGYTYFGWSTLCDAVACVKLARLEGRVAERRISPASAASGHAAGHAGGIGATIAAITMEAPGVEPSGKRGSAKIRADRSSEPSRRDPKIQTDPLAVSSGESRETAAEVVARLRALGFDDAADAIERER